MRVKKADPPVAVEPPRVGENVADCPKCHAPDEAYIWVNENWRVRSMDRPSGLPMVLILESRSHLDLGDLPNMLAAELGVMTVRLERAIRSIDGVARVHVNRWGDGAAHLHLWFLARPYGRLQLRGTFLTLWDEILPPIPEYHWRESLAMVAAWLAEFGGEPLAKPPHIDWKAPASFSQVIQPSEQAAQAPEPDANSNGSGGSFASNGAAAGALPGNDTGAPAGNDTGALSGTDSHAPAGVDTGGLASADSHAPARDDTGTPAGADSHAPARDDTGAPSGDDSGDPAGAAAAAGDREVRNSAGGRSGEGG